MANKQKKKKKSEKPVIYDVIDEVLDLPQENRALCAAVLDDKNAKAQAGNMRFVLNRDVLDIMQDVIDELEMSRGLPVDVTDLPMSDAVVVHILQNEKDLDAIAALAKASSWYARQKAQVRNDSLFVAVTMYNDLNIAVEPYGEGEVAFGVEEAERPVPNWLEVRKDVQIPAPERHLSNLYERRLKQLYDIANTCGAAWVGQFTNIFRRALGAAIRLAEPTDDAGFQFESPGRPLPAQPSTADED